MKTVLYFEIIGKDKNLIKDFEQKLVNKIKEYKDIKINNINFAEPIENEKEVPDIRNPNNKVKVKFLSSYVEIDSEFENLSKLIDFISIYSPSRIEFKDLKEVEIKYNDKSEKYSSDKFAELLNLLSNKIIELAISNSQLYILYSGLAKKFQELNKQLEDSKKNSDKNKSN